MKYSDFYAFTSMVGIFSLRVFQKTHINWTNRKPLCVTLTRLLLLPSPLC